MRDAQQSLMATRMRSKDLCGAAYATNAYMQNAFLSKQWAVLLTILHTVS